MDMQALAILFNDEARRYPLLGREDWARAAVRNYLALQKSIEDATKGAV